MENLGAAIRETREARDLSRRQLGEVFGATEKTIERYENGSSGGVLKELAKIADALGVSTDDILSLSIEIGRQAPEQPATAPNAAPDRMRRLERKMDAVLAALELASGEKAKPPGEPGEDEELGQDEAKGS